MGQIIKLETIIDRQNIPVRKQTRVWDLLYMDFSNILRVLLPSLEKCGNCVSLKITKICYQQKTHELQSSSRLILGIGWTRTSTRVPTGAVFRYDNRLRIRLWTTDRIDVVWPRTAYMQNAARIYGRQHWAHVKSYRHYCNCKYLEHFSVFHRHPVIGVGAQSTLGGTTFLPEKYIWKN